MSSVIYSWIIRTVPSLGKDKVYSQFDPLFASVGVWEEVEDGQWSWQAGDYHLKSAFGRWNESGQWDYDAQTSPCVGAGDVGIWQEQGWSPGEHALNYGVYGGTPMASQEAIQ